MNQEVFEKVKAIIIDKLNVDPAQVVPEARFREDLKADSLDLVELIMAFEEGFGGTISDEDAQKITTVGEAVTFLRRPALPDLPLRQSAEAHIRDTGMGFLLVGRDVHATPTPISPDPRRGQEHSDGPG